MIQCRNSSRFLDEATHAVVPSETARQNLQSDFTIELGVVGEIDFTHSTRAELVADFIAANSCARVNCQVVIWGDSFRVFFEAQSL